MHDRSLRHYGINHLLCNITPATDFIVITPQELLCNSCLKIVCFHIIQTSQILFEGMKNGVHFFQHVTSKTLVVNNLRSSHPAMPWSNQRCEQWILILGTSATHINTTEWELSITRPPHQEDKVEKKLSFIH